MKNSQRRKISLLPLLFALVLLVALLPTALSTQPANDEPTPGNEESTQTQPILGYFKNTRLDLTPYEGKALFLNFFTEWCPYCMVEMPEIKKIFETYSQDELQIILVHVWDGENEANTLSIKEKYGLEDMTFFEDQDMSLAQFIGLPGYPTSIFIDKDGNLAQAIPSALNFEAMAEIIDGMDVARVEESVLPTSTPQ